MVYTLLLLFGPLVFEVAFIAGATGYMAVQFKAPLLDNFGFFMLLLQRRTQLDISHLAIIHRV